jgi:hypothetical protein
MAAVLGIRHRSLARWQAHQRAALDRPRRQPGRPKVVPSSTAWTIRQQYVDKYRQWGPRVLRDWAQSAGLGQYSATTIASLIADLRIEPPPKLTPLRYEVAGPGVMWSEDGAGFRDRGRKRELLLVQDEYSRLKVAYEMCPGPATGAAVCAVLERAFKTYGAPLVLKRDGGSIFDEESVRDLLRKWGVVALTSPPRTPRYNGRMERAVRDVRSFERAQREHGVKGSLEQRIDRSIADLNDDRPRPVLGSRTAREVHEGDKIELPDRIRFRRAVERRRRELEEEATSRHEQDRASRRAIEHVLSRYGLVKWKGCVSTDSEQESVTN